MGDVWQHPWPLVTRCQEFLPTPSHDNQGLRTALNIPCGDKLLSWVNRWFEESPYIPAQCGICITSPVIITLRTSFIHHNMKQGSYHSGKNCFFNMTPAQEERSNGSSPGEQQSNRPVREFPFTKDELGFSGLHGRHGKQQEWGTKLCVWFISHFKIENTKVYFKNTSNQNENSFSSNSLLIYVFSICLHLTFHSPRPPKKYLQS